MLCNAPLNNMYFTVLGTVSPCWLTTTECDRWSEDRSIRDIWFGEHFQRYRNQHAQQQFIGKCTLCKKEHDEGVWPLAKAYEKFPVREYPSLIELELSNQCNLECIMCSGILSSGIRKNRDKLPPLPMIYTNKFIEELKEFIPHLEELRFNGGEPFAQKIVLDICDVVAQIKPELKVNMATNGTIMNDRVARIMDNNNLHVNISIDSLDPAVYEKIRINGHLDVVLKNFMIFKDYCRRNDRELSVMVNPMRVNWEEMATFVAWTSTHDVNLWFNTIRKPEYLALWNLPSNVLRSIYDRMNEQADGLKGYRNYEVFDHLVNHQIKNWYLDSLVS